MKKNVIVIMIILVLGLGVAVLISQKEDPGLIDSFEHAIDKTTVDYGSSDNSSLTVEAATDMAKCGKQSLRLSYELNSGGYMWCARGSNLDAGESARWLVDPLKIRWDAYDAISFWMVGANSGTLAFDVKDAGGELHRFIVQDDSTGWREVVIPFDRFAAREDWQPQTADGNNKLDFPVMSYQWEPKTTGKGTLIFDCVKLVNRGELR